MSEENATHRPLTLAEKASLTSGSDMWTTTPIDGVIAPLVLSDGPHGIRRPAEGDAVGIGNSRPATCFPPAVALASSWNRQLAARVGVALGEEARALGVHVVLGPGLNIKRSPLGGRNFEYFSEDPYLTGRLAAELVRGIQSQGVGATPKHFAVNNQETDRMRVSAEVDERTLREIYLAAFEYVVRHAHPFALMCSYNRINGTYASENRWLLDTVLRGEWGFDGLVMSDWGAVNDRVAAVRAGLDLEMPPSGTDAEVVAAVEQGSLDEAVLDTVAARLATLAKRTAAADVAPGIDVAGHDALAREAAAESIVLLKNDGDVLPLDPAGSGLVAVIGELARTPKFQGGGSSQVVPLELHNALDELRKAAGDGTTVEFAAGYTLDGEADQTLVDAAVDLAGHADVAIVFLGLPEAAESEGYDRTDLQLPANQLDLLAQLASSARKPAVVLANGGVVEIAPWQDQAAAIVEGWLLGQAGGAALADVLFGANSPSGRLAETIPVRLADTSSYLHFPGGNGIVVHGEGRYVGYRFSETMDVPVAYPFGFGLTYTTFDYRRIDVTARGNDSWDIAVVVANAGARAGREVVQLYVSVDETVPTRPVRELRGFEKVLLQPGEETTVHFDLSAQDLMIWDVIEHRWRLEPGEYRVLVGSSCRDIVLSDRITAAGDGRTRALNAMSTIAEWLTHPIGAALLRKRLPPRMIGFLDTSAGFAQMLQQMPLGKLRMFPGGLDSSALAELIEEANSSSTS